MKRWIIGFAVVVLLAVGAGQASASPFVLTFDENGNASFVDNGIAVVGYNGSLLADAVEGGVSLTYLLNGNLVVSGDVLIFETGTNVISDLMRFTNAAGDLSGSQNADRMIFYSVLEAGKVQFGPGTDQADRNFSSRTTFGINELGDDTFSYNVGNIYNGTSGSATATPEPVTAASLGISVLCMAGYGWRRRKVSATAA